MSDIEAELKEGTLLVFDLDNTVMRPAQTLGTDQWFEYLVKEYVGELMGAGTPEETAVSQAIDKALLLWNKVQRVTEIQLVEKETADIIQKAQKAKIPVMALTARPSDLIETTQKQLKSNGVDFTINPPYAKDLEFRDQVPAQFTKGVTYIGPKNVKGSALITFLKKIGLQPKKIVFVDDKVRHVKSVDASTSEAKIPSVCFRYGAADPIVKQFDPKIAGVQLKYFNGLLGDAEAQKLLERH